MNKLPNVILFGPPGVGKSTLIGILKTLRQSAIDLEDLYPNNIRFQIPNLVSNTFLGAADLNPKRKYSNAKKVLLTMASQEEYDRRRAKRDSQQSGKSNQAAHLLSDWEKNVDYDVIITMSSSDSPESVARRLISVLQQKGDKK